jgi:hypothetical protein
MTMGMVAVACFAARAGAVPQGVKITSTFALSELSRQSRQSVRLPLRIAIFEDERAALDVSEVA